MDGFWEIGLNEWDMAAGALLIKEAGGICTDFSGSDAYLSSGNIIAGTPKVHHAILRELQPHLIEGIKK
jgi:myo-inositol-1(or 4)-monophosphatase